MTERCPRPLLRVALTGGIASGKSTVGAWLGELGCSVSDSDQLVAELYQPGQPGTAAVRELFSTELIDDDGAVDRTKLADRVFADPAALRELEAVIHPLVGQAYANLVARSEGILIFEVPLLVETGGADRYDTVVTVEAGPELRLRRAVERGVDPTSAKARIAAQTDSASRRAVADYVLENEGSIEDLRRQVEVLMAALEERLAKRSSS